MDVWAPASLATPFVFDIGKGESFRGEKRYKGVLHFTQSKSYAMHSGRYTGISEKTGKKYSTAPHFTIDLVKGPPDTHIWQHVPLDRAAYAVKTHDRDWLIQIESCWVSEEAKDFPLDRQKKLRELMIWIESQTGIRPKYPVKIADTPGRASSVRMSKADFLAWSGWCGHQHVPSNSHWDPGAVDVGFLFDRGGNLASTAHSGNPADGVASPVKVAEEWPEVLKVGSRHDKVLVVRSVLTAFGYGDFARSDLYNDNVAQGVRAFQKDEQLDFDGKWGQKTHAKAIARIDAAMNRS